MNNQGNAGFPSQCLIFEYFRTDKLKLHLGRIHKKHISSSSDKLVISSNIPTKSIHLQLKTLPSTREKSQPSAQVRPKFHFETVNQKTEIKLDSVRPKINLDSVRPEISLESLRPEINLDPVRSKSEINLDLDRPEINLNPTKRHKEINLNFKISGDHNLAGGICMDTLKFIGQYLLLSYSIQWDLQVMIFINLMSMKHTSCTVGCAKEIQSFLIKFYLFYHYVLGCIKSFQKNISKSNNFSC